MITHGSILVGLAQWLEDQGLATWEPSGAYTLPASPPPVFLDDMPTEPDELIVVSVGTTPGTVANSTDVVAAVQIRTRGAVGDTQSVHAIADPIRGALQALRATTWTGPDLWVPLAAHTSTASLGRDANRRDLRSDNYILHIQERP